MRNVRWLVLACAGLASSCNEVRPHEKPDAAIAAVPVPRASEAAKDAGAKSVRSARPLHSPPRIKASSSSQAGMTAGGELPASDIVLSAGQELVLDFSAGARLHLLGPCVARSAVSERDALLARDCTLSIDLAPAAPRPDSGFLLTTPSAAFSLVRGGGVALRVGSDGASVALVTSGSVTVAAAGDAFPDAPAGLAAGERVEVAVDGTLARSSHPAQALADAERLVASAAGGRAHARASRVGPGTARAPADGLLAELDRALIARIEEVRRQLTREQALVASHRAALAAQSAERMELQAQLASQAALLARARNRLATALAQRAASRLQRAQGREDARAEEAEGLLDPSP